MSENEKADAKVEPTDKKLEDGQLDNVSGGWGPQSNRFFDWLAKQNATGSGSGDSGSSGT